MGQPITWRNVDAPSFGEASRMMLAAQHGINSGFDQFNNVLKTEQATADANWKQLRDNNTQAFLNSINQYRTADEYQAAQKAGIFDQLRQQYGNQIDQAAIRAAEDGRMAILQGRDVQAVNYGNTMADAKEDPAKRAALTALATGDKNGYARIVSENPNARFLPEVASKNRDISRQNTEWKQTDEKAADELLTNKARRVLIGAQANQANAAADHYRTESSSATTSLKAQLAASKSEKAAAELLIKNGPMDAGHMGSYEGKMKFLEGIKKLGVPADEAESVYKQFATSFGGGVPVDGPLGKDGNKTRVSIDLPVSVALSAVEAAGKDWAIRPNWLIGSGRGDRAAKEVTRLMADPAIADGINAAMQANLIQYRPLTKSDGNAPVVQRPTLPKPTNMGDFSGADLVSQTVAIRAAQNEQAKSMMTPEEIAVAQKTGKIPFRIKRLLESVNER